MSFLIFARVLVLILRPRMIASTNVDLEHRATFGEDGSCFVGVMGESVGRVPLSWDIDNLSQER